MTQETELPALPDLDDRRAVEKWAIATGAWRSPFTLDDLRVILRAYATAAVLATPHMRRLTGLWRFGREVLPVANISFEAFLFQLDGFIDEKTRAHPLAPPAVKEG